MDELKISIPVIIDPNSKKAFMSSIQTLFDSVKKEPLNIKIKVDLTQIKELEKILININKPSIGNNDNKKLTQLQQQKMLQNEITAQAKLAAQSELNNIKKSAQESKLRIQLKREEIANEKLLQNEKKKSQQESQKSLDVMSKVVQAQHNFQKFTQNMKPSALNSKFGGFSVQSVQNYLKTAEIDGTTASLNKARAAMVAFENSVKQSGNAGKNIFTMLESKVRSFAAYAASAAVTMALWRTMRDAITNIKNMDIAMTELKKVTDESDVTYQRFFRNSIQGAKELGASVADVIQATANFSRLGYSLFDAETLSKSAIVYKNVGDGIANISDSSASIISTMKAFGVEAKDAMGIVDKFNEIGNNFAISSKDIGVGLQKSASALSVAGNDINQSIALLTAGNEIIQDPDVVGTMLKTSALRLTNTKGKLEELGEDAEGAAESITKLQTQLLNLTKGKVDIMIDENTFKSTYDIMLQMSEVWGSMTQKDQMSSLELMFGKRGANVGASILQNMDTAQKVVEAATQSAGSALIENETYLSSIQGKTEILKASAVDLWDNFINSDMIKFCVDALNSLVNIADAWDSWLVKIPLIILAMSSLGTMFKGISASSWGRDISATFNSIKNVGKRPIIFIGNYAFIHFTNVA